jgi:hypothetical protein
LNDFFSKEIASFPPQLSYSVNESLSEVAVRDSSAGVKGQKHAAKKQVFRRKRLMKVEMQFLPYFFLLRQKSKKIHAPYES